MFCSKVFVVAVVILDVTDEVLKHIFILFIRVQRLYKWQLWMETKEFQIQYRTALYRGMRVTLILRLTQGGSQWRLSWTEIHQMLHRKEEHLPYMWKYVSQNTYSFKTQNLDSILHLHTSNYPYTLGHSHKLDISTVSNSYCWRNLGQCRISTMGMY